MVEKIRVPRNNGLASSLTYQQEIERLRKVIEEFKRYDKKRKDYYQALVTEHDILVQKNRELTAALIKKPSLDDVAGLSVTDKKRFLKVYSSLSEINTQRAIYHDLLQVTSNDLKRISGDLDKIFRLLTRANDTMTIDQLSQIIQQTKLRFAALRGRLNYANTYHVAGVFSEETPVSATETQVIATETPVSATETILNDD